MGTRIASGHAPSRTRVPYMIPALWRTGRQGEEKARTRTSGGPRIRRGTPWSHPAPRTPPAPGRHGRQTTRGSMPAGSAIGHDPASGARRRSATPASLGRDDAAVTPTAAVSAPRPSTPGLAARRDGGAWTDHGGMPTTSGTADAAPRRFRHLSSAPGAFGEARSRRPDSRLRWAASRARQRSRNGTTAIRPPSVRRPATSSRKTMSRDLGSAPPPTAEPERTDPEARRSTCGATTRQALVRDGRRGTDEQQRGERRSPPLAPARFGSHALDLRAAAPVPVGCLALGAGVGQRIPAARSTPWTPLGPLYPTGDAIGRPDRSSRP